MKSTIEGFNQDYAMTLRKEVEIKGKLIEKKIDCTDLVILRWFVDFYPKMKKFVVDGVEYAWVGFSKLKEDLPLIDISRRAFSERMQKLVDFGILTYVLIKEGGTCSAYGFGENYIRMVERETTTSDENSNGMRSNDIGTADKQQGGMRSNDIGVCVQTTYKDISIKDKSIKDKSNNIYINEFESLWKEYPRKIGKPNALKDYIKARNNGTSFEDIKKGIENYNKFLKIKGWSSEYIKQGSTWFHQECWTDEYDLTPTSQPKQEQKNQELKGLSKYQL